MDSDVPLMIEKSAIWSEVKKIIANVDAEKIKTYTALLHIDKYDVNIIKILSIDISKDFANKVGDQVNIEFQLGLGDYIKKLYPYRNNIEMTIKTRDVTQVPRNDKSDKLITLTRYKAVFLQNENRAVLGTDLDRHDYESLNINEIINVKLQLIDTSLEILRVVSTSGIFMNSSQEDLIRSIMVNTSQSYKIGGKPAIDGLDIVKPDNPLKLKHTIIPDGVLLHDLPSYLQTKMGGVYSYGIGTYLQSYKNKKLWFVYPLFNVNRFSENVDKLIFYAVPPNKLPGINRTYYTEDTITHIVLTASRKYYDSADVDYMNDGVGFRSADAYGFMKKPVKMTEKGPVGLRHKLNNEVGTIERSDNLNHAPISTRTDPNSDRGISSNPFTEYSRMTARGIARIDLVWENCNIDLIQPGMPCKYVYMVGNKIVELKGTILFAHVFTTLVGNISSSTTYRSQAAITLAVERYNDKPTKPKLKSAGAY